MNNLLGSPSPAPQDEDNDPHQDSRQSQQPRRLRGLRPQRRRWDDPDRDPYVGNYFDDYA